MRPRNRQPGIPVQPVVRCAVYCRKSSEEGLRQEFNSLDAQRAACEAYVASQRGLGWECLPERYDDGGFSGGTLERPALQHLLADVAAGKIDAVVVYKIDRLSRSLADFMQIVAKFEQRNVSFVSVTQAFDTSSSMGRLTLNILLSFAQFEREIIGERIRDKLAASRQRGKWTGGTPILGYDVDRTGPSPRLVVNPVEAARVVELFNLYVEHRSLLAVAAELNRRGWRSKAWTTRDGRQRGGEPFDKLRLHVLLTNPLVTGKVRHKGTVYPGEHEAIVPAELFDRVQMLLKRNAGKLAARAHGDCLLAGRLMCKACNRTMSRTFTTPRGRRYSYYACTQRVKRGRAACPTPSLPAAEIERAVVDEIRAIARNPALVAATLEKARKQHAEDLARLAAGRRLVARDASAGADVAALDAEIAALEAQTVTKRTVAAAFADFDALWAALTPREQTRVVALLVERVEFDAATSTLSFAFSPTGIRLLAQERAEPSTEAVA